jgi:hypothetical protein
MTMADDYRREITACFDSGDWHGAYRWAKGWIGSGGGARSVEPWLVYVASALKESQRRPAVHSCDLALKHWISRRAARGVLLYARGEVIRRHLRDPKTALADLRAAEETVPKWLRDEARVAREECEEEAQASRKRKPSVKSAPAYSSWRRLAGGSVREPPPLWELTHEIIKG